VTRRKNTYYIHLCKKPISNTIELKPLAVLPFRATLLNNGAPVECVVDMLPNDHASHESFLHLRNLPVEQFDDEVLVVKLDFK